MDYDIKVVSVDRLGGKVQKVVIDVLSFRLGLIKNGDNIKEVERIRLDGSRNLDIPPAPYRAMMRVARGIFFEKKKGDKMAKKKCPNPSCEMKDQVSGKCGAAVGTYCRM